WTLTVFRYIVLFFTIALVTLITMGLQTWLFSFLAVAAHLLAVSGGVRGDFLCHPVGHFAYFDRYATQV
ncbi:hypothetical protein ACW184_08885, partial [Limosilactobacillus fermentum]